MAIKDYIVVAKKSPPRHKQRSKAKKRQLQYIKRNLYHIYGLISLGATLSALTKRKYKMLLVVTEVYRQQLWLYENKQQSISDRIVTLNQSQIRPIVRGKGRQSV